ncbi:DUF1652 domain-containing protein [Stutzerimonas azotifigens]|uniref:DUF1652 domain-containing protein n=1 Tax=Stutzerimonas azotifigens TaxID=291995 RepID=A0ABR5Z1F3_9GAMM|nr:DUF1652 domain-containing protein [Stutzerimonas azotifigens]MBA1274055.1 DUF1652 domain-containing protein [Stutzerimonas azotifigens]
MDQRLSLAQIEAILHDHLQPYRCECRTQLNRTLSIRVYGEPSGTDELTVLGVTDEQCRDAANLVRLAQELRIELFATRGVLEIRHD